MQHTAPTATFARFASRRLNRRRSGGAAALLLVAALAAAVGPGGCNLAAPASYALFGPGKIDAEHTLAQSRTVVFVDDRQNVLPRTALRAMIGEKVSEDLISQDLIPSAVRPVDAIAATRQHEEGGKPLSIAAIGRELECQQVIYVQVVGFSVSGDGREQTGAGATPTAKASVKVIDVVNNSRTYPLADTKSGREVLAKLREVDLDEIRTVAKRRAVEDRLAMELGLVIGQLFYEHERIELGKNLGPRSQ